MQSGPFFPFLSKVAWQLLPPSPMPSLHFIFPSRICSDGDRTQYTVPWGGKSPQPSFSSLQAFYRHSPYKTQLDSFPLKCFIQNMTKRILNYDSEREFYVKCLWRAGLGEQKCSSEYVNRLAATGQWIIPHDKDSIVPCQVQAEAQAAQQALL